MRSQAEEAAYWFGRGVDQEVKEGKKPLTNSQRKRVRRNKRREEQRSRGLDLGYMADSER